jgi:GT2 family glycosyltransferase
MRIAVIVLNWNAARDTIRCVREVAAWHDLQPGIWVVDNASTDGSAEAIAAECPDVHLIRNSANLGFAGGNNRGIAQVLTAGDAPVLLLNNDARISEADVAQLVATLQADERVGFVGPLLYEADRPDHLLAAGARNPAYHHQSHILTLGTGEAVRVVECIPGTVILVRAEVFRAVGMLDEMYFFGSEVADLCLRARQNDYISVVDTRARAFHSLERSTAQRETLHTYYIIRNRFLLIHKLHRQCRYPLMAFWTIYGLALWARVSVAGRHHTGRAIWLGLLDGLWLRFGGRNERVLGAGGGLFAPHDERATVPSREEGQRTA